MFTLKLYRRFDPHPKMQKIIEVKEVRVFEIGHKKGDEGTALEIHAIFDDLGHQDIYYMGAPEEGMESYGRDNLHLDHGYGSWWGYGYLENAAGKTCAKYWPGSFDL